MASSRIVFLALAALLCAGFLALHFSVTGWVEIDDAYITFRYARNIARGAGPVFNPGERVEGISNLLWAYVLAPFSMLHLDLLWASRGLNIAFSLSCAAILAAVIHRAIGSRALSAIGGALPASHLGYALWQLPGLETIFYSALLLRIAASLVRLRDRDSRAALWIGGLAAFIVPAVRPEAGFVAFGLIAAALPAFIAARRPRPAIAILACLLVGGTALLGFRWFYYHDILPNTYYSKVNSRWVEQSRAGYLWNIARYHCWSLAGAAIGVLAVLSSAFSDFRKRESPATWTTAGLAAIGAVAFNFVFIWRVGADWMPGWRYFVPVIPFVALLCALGFWRIASFLLRGDLARWSPVAASISALAVALAQLMTFSPADLKAADHQRVWTQETRGVALQLAPLIPPGSLLAVAAAGTIPYFLPDVRVLDMLGLNDRHIAKHGHAADPVRWEKTDENYILGRKPDFIVIPFMPHPQTGERIAIPALCWPGVYNHPDFKKNYELAWTFDQVTMEPFWVFRRKAEAKP